MSRFQVMHYIGKPFRAIWSGLTKIASLNRTQVRSLVTVGFLGGMVSLSAENWFITFYLDGVVNNNEMTTEAQTSFIGFMLDRMRNTSMLQGLIALALTAVILNADRMSFQAGQVKASIGGSKPAEGTGNVDSEDVS